MAITKFMSNAIKKWGTIESKTFSDTLDELKKSDQESANYGDYTVTKSEEDDTYKVTDPSTGEVTTVDNTGDTMKLSSEDAIVAGSVVTFKQDDKDCWGTVDSIGDDGNAAITADASCGLDGPVTKAVSELTLKPTEETKTESKQFSVDETVKDEIDKGTKEVEATAEVIDPNVTPAPEASDIKGAVSDDAKKVEEQKTFSDDVIKGTGSSIDNVYAMLRGNNVVPGGVQ